MWGRLSSLPVLATFQSPVSETRDERPKSGLPCSGFCGRAMLRSLFCATNPLNLWLRNLLD
jgi:hypothetical protein